MEWDRDHRRGLRAAVTAQSATLSGFGWELAAGQNSSAGHAVIGCAFAAPAVYLLMQPTVVLATSQPSHGRA